MGPLASPTSFLFLPARAANLLLSSPRGPATTGPSTSGRPFPFASPLADSLAPPVSFSLFPLSFANAQVPPVSSISLIFLGLQYDHGHAAAFWACVPRNEAASCSFCFAGPNPPHVPTPSPAPSPTRRHGKPIEAPPPRSFAVREQYRTTFLEAVFTRRSTVPKPLRPAGPGWQSAAGGAHPTRSLDPPPRQSSARAPPRRFLFYAAESSTKINQ